MLRIYPWLTLCYTISPSGDYSRKRVHFFCRQKTPATFSLFLHFAPDRKQKPQQYFANYIMPAFVLVASQNPKTDCAPKTKAFFRVSPRPRNLGCPFRSRRQLGDASFHRPDRIPPTTTLSSCRRRRFFLLSPPPPLQAAVTAAVKAKTPTAHRRRGRKGKSVYRGVCVTREGKWRAVIYKERKQASLAGHSRVGGGRGGCVDKCMYFVCWLVFSRPTFWCCCATYLLTTIGFCLGERVMSSPLEVCVFDVPKTKRQGRRRLSSVVLAGLSWIKLAHRLACLQRGLVEGGGCLGFGPSTTATTASYLSSVSLPKKRQHLQQGILSQQTVSPCFFCGFGFVFVFDDPLYSGFIISQANSQ